MEIDEIDNEGSEVIRETEGHTHTNTNSQSGDGADLTNPIGFDLIHEFQGSKSIQRIKAKITAIDKDFRSKTNNPLRSELYNGLKRYFKNHPVKNFRMFFDDDISEEEFEKFMKVKPGLEKLKSWDIKHKIQNTIKYLIASHEDSRPFLYSTAAMLDLIHISKNSDKFQWSTFRLLERTPEAEVLDGLATKDFVKQIKSGFLKSLEDLENDLFDEDSKTVDVFCGHSKLIDDTLFLGVRKQKFLNLESFKKSTKKLKSTKAKANKAEKSETFTVAIKRGVPHIFITGYLSEHKKVIQIIISCLGYNASERQKLVGSSLNRLALKCKKGIVEPPLDIFEKGFREEEAQMASRGEVWGNRVFELGRQYDMATFRTATIDNAVNEKPGIEKYTLQSKSAVTELKFKGRPEEVDESILNLFKLGFITDLKPFIHMKRTQANYYKCNES